MGTKYNHLRDITYSYSLPQLVSSCPGKMTGERRTDRNENRERKKCSEVKSLQLQKIKQQK